MGGGELGSGQHPASRARAASRNGKTGSGRSPGFGRSGVQVWGQHLWLRAAAPGPPLPQTRASPSAPHRRRSGARPEDEGGPQAARAPCSARGLVSEDPHPGPVFFLPTPHLRPRVRKAGRPDPHPPRPCLSQPPTEDSSSWEGCKARAFPAPGSACRVWAALGRPSGRRTLTPETAAPRVPLRPGPTSSAGAGGLGDTDAGRGAGQDAWRTNRTPQRLSAKSGQPRGDQAGLRVPPDPLGA